MPGHLRQPSKDDRASCGLVARSAYRAPSSGSQVCRRKATTIASSSIDSTVELGCFGPVGRSATKLRLRHLAAVFGLVPWRYGPQTLLTTLYRSTDCLCRNGAAMKNLAQSASLHAEKIMHHQSLGPNT